MVGLDTRRRWPRAEKSASTLLGQSRQPPQTLMPATRYARDKWEECRLWAGHHAAFLRGWSERRWCMNGRR